MSRLRVYLPNTSTELPILEGKWIQRKGESDELTFKYPADGPNAELLQKPQQLELRASNGVDVLRTFTVSTFLPPRSRVYGDVPKLEITARARSLDELLDTVITEYPVMFVLSEALPLPSSWTGGFASQTATILTQPVWETLYWGVGDVIADVFGAAHVSRARINNEIVKPTVLQSATSLLLTRKQPGVYVDRSWVGGGDAEEQPAGAKLVFQHNLATHLRNVLWYFQDKANPGAGPITLGDVSFTGYDANEFYEFHFDGMSIREALDVMYVTAGRPGVMYIDDNGALQWKNKSSLQSWTLLYGEENLREYRATPNYERLVTRVYALGGEVDGERVRLQAPVDRNTATYGVIETTLTFDDALNTEELEARAESYLDEFAEPKTTYDLVAWEGDTIRRPGHSIRLRDIEYSLDVTEAIVERERDLNSPLCTYRIGAEPVALEEILENIARSRRMARDTYFEPGDGATEIPPELLAHLADTANPHQTTKAQVGLDRVDNWRQARVPWQYGLYGETRPQNNTLASWAAAIYDPELGETIEGVLLCRSLVRAYTENSGDTATVLDTIQGRNLKIRAGHDNTLANVLLASGPGGQLRLQHYLATHGGVVIVGDTNTTVRHSFSQGGAAYHFLSLTTPKLILPATDAALELIATGKPVKVTGTTVDLNGATLSNSKAGQTLKLDHATVEILNKLLGGTNLTLEVVNPDTGDVIVNSHYMRVRRIMANAIQGQPETYHLELRSDGGSLTLFGRKIELTTTDGSASALSHECKSDVDLEWLVAAGRKFKFGGVSGTNSGGVWDGTHRLGFWGPYSE